MNESCRTLRRPGIMLTELILLLALAAVVASLATWGFAVQLDTQRRLAVAADRQRALDSALRQLRADLMTATRIDFAAGPASATEWSALARRAARDVTAPLRPSDRVPIELPPVSLHRPDGVIRYRLHVLAPLHERPDDTSERPAPIQQTLVRTDVDGVARRWKLYGQRLELMSDPSGSPRLLRVRCTSQMRYRAGHQSARRFETTLRAGGHR